MLFRYCKGVIPVFLKKARRNVEVELNPERSAISSIFMVKDR